MNLFEIHRITDGIRNRLACLFSRGTVERVDDAGALQKIQVTLLAGEVPDDAERVGSYGFSSNPPPSSEAILASVNGARDHMIIIGTEHPDSRPRSLAPGDVALYNDQGVVILISGTVVSISGASLVTIGGDVHIGGNLVVDGTINGHEP